MSLRVKAAPAIPCFEPGLNRGGRVFKQNFWYSGMVIQEGEARNGKAGMKGRTIGPPAGNKIRMKNGSLEQIAFVLFTFLCFFKHAPGLYALAYNCGMLFRAHRRRCHQFL